MSSDFRFAKIDVGGKLGIMKKLLLIISTCSILLASPKKEHLILLSRLTPWELIASTSGHMLAVSAIQRYLKTHDGLGAKWSQCCCAETLSELEQILQDIKMIYLDLSCSDIAMLQRFGLDKDEIQNKLLYITRLKELNLEKESTREKEREMRTLESRFSILDAYRKFSISPELHSEQQYIQSLPTVEPMVKYLLSSTNPGIWINILRKNRILWRFIRRHVNKMVSDNQFNSLALLDLQKICNKDFYHWLDAKTEQLALSYPDEAGHLLERLKG